MWNACPSCLNYQTIYNFCSVLWSWPLKKVVFTIKCPIMATLLLPSHCSVIAYTDGYALCLQSVIEKAWLCWETGNSHQNICRDWVDDTPPKKVLYYEKSRLYYLRMETYLWLMTPKKNSLILWKKDGDRFFTKINLHSISKSDCWMRNIPCYNDILN